MAKWLGDVPPVTHLFLLYRPWTAHAAVPLRRVPVLEAATLPFLQRCDAYFQPLLPLPPIRGQQMKATRKKDSGAATSQKFASAPAREGVHPAAIFPTRDAADRQGAGRGRHWTPQRSGRLDAVLLVS